MKLLYFSVWSHDSRALDVPPSAIMLQSIFNLTVQDEIALSLCLTA
jgi:hypothetical protein